MNTPFFWTIGNLMGRWRPGIGDPSLMGWLTVASYLACAVVSLSAGWTGRRMGKDGGFWFSICILMILLGINKQLDLQSLFTEIGRQVASHQGWMEQRRLVQFWFIVCLGSAAILSFSLLATLRTDLFRRHKMAFAGLFFLVLFIMIRAVGFHHVDKMLGSTFLDLRMNWLFELGGIYTVFLAAAVHLYRLRRRDRREERGGTGGVESVAHPDHGTADRM